MFKQMIKKHKLLSLLTVSIALGVSIFFIKSPYTSSQDNSSITPTLFIHGYKGGPGSFNTMMDRLEDNRLGEKEMTVRVSSKGKIMMRGRFSAEQHPFIQVIFHDNRASLTNQTLWLQKIMHKLKVDYGIQQVNLVGHSMGGLAAANFMTQKNNSLPTVEKLIVMGSPFKGIDKEEYFDINSGEALTDLRPDAQLLSRLTGNKNSFPNHLKVLAIAGAIDAKYTSENADTIVKQKNYDGGDGLVSVSSALGIQEVVPANNYHEVIVRDIEATHSGLHEHPDVDKEVAAFLRKK
ncbi:MULTISPECIES: alpha/beta hydrolase [Thalassobacillus]|uniref:alpha/beta hydrolase n=1 Tax=Thalassobacillus TaxID=331971 RepID=UPI000A1CEDC0|nr:alpha/beta hydrolase [Thalassobacillus devorans]